MSQQIEAAVRGHTLHDCDHNAALVGIELQAQAFGAAHQHLLAFPQAAHVGGDQAARHVADVEVEALLAVSSRDGVGTLH